MTPHLRPLRPLIHALLLPALLPLTVATLTARPAAGGVHVGPGQSFATIQAASRAHAVHAGDTVYVHAGTYSDKGAYIDSLIGTASQWIVIRPWENDSVSIHVQYTFQHAQYVKVRGLHFYGSDAAMAGSYYHLLYFDYTYECFTGVHDIVVENCAFTDLNVPVSQGASAAFLKFAGVDRFVVEGCVFRNGTNVADGVSMNASRNGIVRACRFESIPGYGSHCKGGAKNLVYERNLFINCRDAGIVAGGDTGPAFFCPLAAPWEADSIRIESNVFVSGATGIRLGACHNTQVRSNTCFKAAQWALRCLNESSNGIVLENNTIENNIFTTDSPYGIYLNASGGFQYTTHVFRNNLFHAYRQKDPATISFGELPGAVVSGTLIGDPMFADTARMDFSLRVGSPAIGAGITAASPLLDYAGRSFATPRSIGAIEFTTATSVQSTPVGAPRRVPLTAFPNPAGARFTVRCGDGGVLASVVLHDLLGRSVRTVRAHASEAVIDVASLPRGMYVADAIRADGWHAQTMVVLR